jgi:hypothetical protein
MKEASHLSPSSALSEDCVYLYPHFPFVFMSSSVIKYRDNFCGIKDYCFGVRVLSEWWILADMPIFTNTERVNSQELYNFG